MPDQRIYLTVSRERRLPQNDFYIAVITKGQPQMGDTEITVLMTKLCECPADANEWFQIMLVERPWEIRN